MLGIKAPHIITRVAIDIPAYCSWASFFVIVEQQVHGDIEVTYFYFDNYAKACTFAFAIKEVSGDLDLGIINNIPKEKRIW